MPENIHKPQIRILTHEEEIDGNLWLTVIIKDNGIGWSYEQMPERIWERYHHNQRLVEHIGGTYEYYAKYKVGSLVIMRLPVKDHETSKLYLAWLSLVMLMYSYKERVNLGVRKERINEP